MKKHPLLLVDYHSSTRLKPQDQKTLNQNLATASNVLGDLLKEGVIKGPVKKQYHLSLLICGDARIKKLNKEYRQKDKVTDVLSFPAFEELRKKVPAGGELHFGDMAICFPQTIRQAKKFDIGVWDEFIHLFFHGLLHLMGYDHEVSLEEEKLMQKWEDRALKIFTDKKKGSP